MPTPTLAQIRVVNDVLEAFHAILYFAGPVQRRWAGLGMEPRSEGYVAGRAAPMGPVGPRLAAAAFFNFNPTLFHRSLPGAWEKADPATVLRHRAAGLQETLEEVAAPTDSLDEVVELATAAVVDLDLAGRPLAAANADVELPDQPFARAWQAVAVLREHRGDGHVARLVTAGLAPVEALVLMAGWQDRISARFLRRSRLWSDDDWAAAVAGLHRRGLADVDGGLTDEGRSLREEIERDTDRLAARPYERLGIDGTRRLVEVVRPLAVALAAGGAYPRPPDVPEALPDA